MAIYFCHSVLGVLESTEWTDFAFVLITGIIAYHGISYRDVEGERELVHLLFG